MKTLKKLEDLQQALKKLGETQRDLNITKAELGEQVAELHASYSSIINNLTKQNEELTKQITDFCNTNFEKVFKKGEKTAKLITGEISRRAKPASIGVSDLDLAIKTLKELHLEHFLKVKEDLNKAALLNQPEIIPKIEGIELIKGLESLIIKPYQTE